jgi:hypothetical protein
MLYHIYLTVLTKRLFIKFSSTFNLFFYLFSTCF